MLRKNEKDEGTKRTHLSSLGRVSRRDSNDASYMVCHWDYENAKNTLDREAAGRLGLLGENCEAKITIIFANLRFEAKVEIGDIRDHAADVKIGTEFLEAHNACLQNDKIFLYEKQEIPNRRGICIPILGKDGHIDADSEFQNTKGIRSTEVRDIYAAPMTEITYTPAGDNDPMRTVATTADGKSFYCRIVGCGAQNLDADSFANHWNKRNKTKYTCTRRDPHGLETVPYSKKRRVRMLEAMGEEIARDFRKLARFNKDK